MHKYGSASDLIEGGAVIKGGLGQFFCDDDIVGDSGTEGDEPVDPIFHTASIAF